MPTSNDLGNISRLSLRPLITCSCTICGADFEKAEGSRREVCSFQCKAERSRRYSRKYQADGRRVLAEFRSRFDGRDPTDEEILQLLDK
ncbi:hypothetical protein IFT66_14670 [Rhizobium sp. CFBP 13726]|uniref:hypothetical protein n=1 Tax=Rhizobium sp. CFBP 13726 TaxID=2775296 RepID=UPI001781404B|nr:hypothetical protein [Rhizobium sp. CFBP 13726]MBD8652329.1 hypothetical protein [Rhizobium sp. CFBP 13726]